MDNKIKYGDVSTPQFLVDKILDLLPDSVWNNVDYKWLDPGCGNGIFIYTVYKRLLVSLKKYFKNEEDIKKHILNNMLYMIEINNDYYDELKKKFIEDTNIYICNFIEWNTQLKFDVIIGNPPYNFNGNIKVPTNNFNNKKLDGKSIWKLFLRKSLALLNDLGFLSIIIPVLWMKPDKEQIYHSLFKNNILKIICFDNTETNKIFSYNAQTPVSCVSIQKKNNTNDYQNILIYDNEIHHKFNSYYLKYLSPIPLKYSNVFSIFQPYIEKYGSMMNIVNKTNMPPKKCSLNNIMDDVHVFKNIHSCIIKNKTQPELLIKYSNIELPYYNQTKIVCAHKMYGFPYFDKNGSYGISNRDNYVFIVNNKHYKKLFNFLSTSFVRTLFKATRYRMMFLEKYIFELLPNIINMDDLSENINNQTLKDYFKLNNQSFEFEENSKYENFLF